MKKYTKDKIVSIMKYRIESEYRKHKHVDDWPLITAKKIFTELSEASVIKEDAEEENYVPGLEGEPV